MSEKIFACLLLLYPSRFRKQYETEIMQLYRDRMRDETGFFARFHLCFDLIWDAAAGLPDAYRNSYGEMTAVASSPIPQGIPSFRLLQKEPLRPGSVLLGSILALTAIGIFAFLMSRAPAYRQLARGAMSPIEAVLQRLNQATSRGTGQDAGGTASATGSSHQADSKANPSAVSAASAGVKLDAAERSRVIHAVADNLNRYYMDSGRARGASAEVVKAAEAGEYDAIEDGHVFAARLTRDVRGATEDRHLVIVFSSTPLPNIQGDPALGALAEYRAEMHEVNCTFEKTEVLPGNIGYVKLNSFPDPEVCAPVAKAVMNRLNGADAIIFDLRDNTGGYPNMVEEIAAPLFDHPVPWYNPKAPSASASFIHSPVPGSRLADKPVYILTSSRTFSGAEQFAYDLKMLKRATLVGETTGGGAHVGVFHRLDDHFGMGIPESRITNPYGKPDWEGTGVQPDIQVPAKDALVTAEKLARERLRK